MMADLYQVSRSYGGGYTIRPTTDAERVAGAAGAIAGNIIGASIAGLRNAARNAQDRRIQRAIDTMEQAADVEDFARLLALSHDFVLRYPQLPHGHASLAAALTENGQYDEAIRETAKAEQLGLDKRDAHMMRAEAYERKGSIGNAIEEYSALILDREVHDLALFARAHLLLEIGDLDQALADINQCIAILPHSFAYLLRGDIYRARGELEKSINSYTVAHRLSSGFTIVLERRAEVYEQLGKTQEAQADREAVKRASEDDAARRKEQDEQLEEARALLASLRSFGARPTLADMGREIDYGGVELKKLKPETVAKLNRLKPQLLQLLRDELALALRDTR